MRAVPGCGYNRRVPITAFETMGGEAAGVIVHGGAGDVPAERRAAHAEGCRVAAAAAMQVLAGGGRALDAVQRAVEILEDDPRFNAGTGACLTLAGHVELDASIMDGRDLRFGGVCALPPFKNPIAIARAVLEDGAHVLYAGEGAAELARRAGFSPVDESELVTEAARKKLEAAIAAGRAANWAGGTVGAVARDRAGSVAAATSTGGTAGKRRGRVGDTPIPGGGTWADDLAGAVSATGHGEGILRVALASAVAADLAGGALAGQAASDGILMLERRVGSPAGVIVVDRQGRLGFARSTSTMSWAAAWEGCGETRYGS